MENIVLVGMEIEIGFIILCVFVIVKGFLDIVWLVNKIKWWGKWVIYRW